MARSNWIEDSLFANDLKVIAGADEAGRGACAGPLVAASVALDQPSSRALISSLRSLLRLGDHEVPTLDSKKLGATDRELLFDQIRKIALDVEVVIIEPGEIDRFGLQTMNESAMRRSASQLSVQVDYLLTDGYPIDGVAMPSLAVWKGDAVSLTVGAASIIAKVTRDRIMIELDHQYPGYGFAGHKGYSSKAHMDAIAQRGILPIHRTSYANVAAFKSN